MALLVFFRLLNLLRYVVLFLGILLIDEAWRKSLPRLGLHRVVLHRLLSGLTWIARCWHGSVHRC